MIQSWLSNGVKTRKQLPEPFEIIGPSGRKRRISSCNHFFASPALWVQLTSRHLGPRTTRTPFRGICVRSHGIQWSHQVPTHCGLPVSPMANHWIVVWYGPSDNLLKDVKTLDMTQKILPSNGILIQLIFFEKSFCYFKSYGASSPNLFGSTLTAARCNLLQVVLVECRAFGSRRPRRLRWSCHLESHGNCHGKRVP